MSRMTIGSGPDHEERYTATKVFALALSAVVAIYGFMGWFSAGEFFKAIVCLLAQGLAINSAIAARRAFSKGKPFHGLGGLTFTAGFALWSEQGLHHAWTADGSEISPLLTWFLCIVEPLLFWFTESVQLARKPKTAEEAADEALAEFRAEPVKRKPNLRTIAGGLGGAAALAFTPAVARAESPEPDAISMREPVRNFEPNRAQAKLLLAQGLTPYKVHKSTGVPLSTCKRWAKAA